MKLSLTLPALAALVSGPLLTAAIPEEEIPRCGMQAECLDFTVKEVDLNVCNSGECEYRICMIPNYDKPGCVKPVDGTSDHACSKVESACQRSQSGFATPNGVLTTDIETSEAQCQRVKPSGKAEFLLKDGSLGCNSGAQIDLDGGLVALCHGRPPTVDTCMPGEQPRSECWWRIFAPPDCPNGGGMVGDPHVARWNGKRFSYHGECDLVMIRSSDFGNGEGLDLHIRTKIQKFYSFVETMALRIGNNVLELSHEHVYFNGHLSEQGLPSSISGFPISEEKDGANRVVRISLHNGDHIQVKIYKMFLSVNVVGRKADFGTSVGLLGDFHTGDMLARDGETILALDDEFGAEWQVQADEAMLFHDRRPPQLPQETCRMPSISAARGLRNGDTDFEKKAKEACGKKDPEEFDYCVFDVMATGDLGMAGAW